MPRPPITQRARTAWHPLLALVYSHELPRSAYQVLAELTLTHEPLRVDIVVVRRKPRARPALAPHHLLGSLVDDLGEHTLVHFKGPTDELGRADPSGLLAYAFQYQVLTRTWEPGRLQLRVIANRLTPRFLEQVKRLGGHLTQRAQGLWRGTLGPFEMRLVETRSAWLHPGEHVLYAFSRGFVENPSGAGRLRKSELALYQFLAQQVAQLSRGGVLDMLRETAKLTRSFRRFLLRDFIPTLTPEEMSVAFSGLDPSKLPRALAKLDPEQRLAGLDPEQRLAGLDPEQRLAGLEPEQRLAGLEPEQRLAGLNDREVVDALLRRLPKDLAVAFAAELKAREGGRLRRGAPRPPRRTPHRKH